MTDQFKEITKVKVLDAMIAEGLTNKEAAEAIGIPDNYLSMIKSPKMWPKCPAKAWEAALKWVNSGQTLKEYAVKHGKVRPDPESQPVEELHPPKEKPQKRPSSANGITGLSGQAVNVKVDGTIRGKDLAIALRRNI